MRLKIGRSGRRLRLLVGGGLLAAVLTFAVLGAWAFWLEPNGLRVREETISLPGWPASDAGLRIAVLTDIHAGAPFIDLAKLRRVVAMTNAARPDIVVFTGDLVIQGVVGGRFIPPEIACGILRDLRAPLGLYAVLGNHDHWLNAPRVIESLRGAGFQVLEDDAVLVEGGGRSFWIAGISDYTDAPHNVRAALKPVAEDDRPVIALTHDPDVFPLVPPRVALTIAGHTHGGQVDFPFLGRLVVPSRFGSRYAAGLVVEEGRGLYVATGIGTSYFCVRFRVPPEITILRLAPGPATRS